MKMPRLPSDKAVEIFLVRLAVAFLVFAVFSTASEWMA
jgi:hypothetical protein